MIGSEELVPQRVPEHVVTEGDGTGAGEGDGTGAGEGTGDGEGTGEGLGDPGKEYIKCINV